MVGRQVILTLVDNSGGGGISGWLVSAAVLRLSGFTVTSASVGVLEGVGVTDAVGSTDGCEGRSSDEDGDAESSSDDVEGDTWAGGEAVDSCCFWRRGISSLRVRGVSWARR